MSENADNDEDIHQDYIEDLYEDCFNDLYVDHQIIIYIREMVEEIRKLSSFIKNSSKTIEIIQKLQLNMNNKVLRVKNDVPTRWNSTLLMTNRMIELHDPINEFRV